jgi:hypothetical protein
VVLGSASCGALGVDTELVDLARDMRLCKESESGRSEPLKRWRVGVARSSDHLDGSACRGRSLRASEALEPPGVVRGRAAFWSSRTGRAADREPKPTFFSRTASSSRRDDVTSTTRGGDDVDDPDMSVQSTATLGSSPLHVCSVDGSSLEETPRSPAFHRLMQLSFRSRLAISRSLCCAFHVALRLSAPALFRLKIASSRRGALAGTRCAHFRYEGRERTSQQSSVNSEKADSKLRKPRLTKTCRRGKLLTNFSVPLWGSIGRIHGGGHE